MRVFFLVVVAALGAGCEAESESPSPSGQPVSEIGSPSPITASEVNGPIGDSLVVASEEREECDFDQDEQAKDSALLRAKYPGSRLEEGYVVIPVEEGEIWVGIGGCAHFGITVELRMRSVEEAWTEARFLAQIVSLAETYSQGYVDPGRFTKVIEDKRWERDADAAIDKSYLIHYDGDEPDAVSRFEAYEQQHEGKRTVGFTYSFL